MRKSYSLQNTEEYDEYELKALNTEFEKRFAAGDWNFYPYDEEEDWDAAKKAFADEVSQR